VVRHRVRLVSLHAIAISLSCSIAHAQQTNGCGATPYDCAVAQVERQELDAAIRTLHQILKQSPRDLKALNLLGIALTNAGRMDEANQRFQQALKLDPTFYPALKNLAINEFNTGRLAEARRHFDQVLTRVPEDEVAHVHLAEIHYQAKGLRAALPHYEKAQRRVFQNPTWMLHYAACLLEQGERVRAAAVLDQLDANDATSRFEAGTILGEAGVYTEAARFFASARRSYKEPYAAAYNQILMLIDAGNHEDAIRVAEELFAQGTQPAELYNLISRAYVKAGHIQQAYDALRTATRLEPGVEAHYLDLVLICLDHENFDLGLEIVEVGLHHRPSSGPLHVQRGVLLAMKGSVAEAEKEFDAARKLAPEAVVPYIALAMAWMETGQSAKAVDLLRTRSRADEKNPLIFYTLGVALLRSGADPDDAAGAEAIAAFDMAVRLNPDFAPARLQLGKLLLKRGDAKQAVVHLERAVALDPDSPAPAYSLAQAYRRTGDTARAQELLARVSKLNAQERGDDSGEDLKRIVRRIVREAR
jgi:predicted Zn-dependent protease